MFVARYFRKEHYKVVLLFSAIMRAPEKSASEDEN